MEATALLILILTAGDPASGAAAQAVAEALRTQDAKARVVLAPEAGKMLAERGLSDADLLHRSEKPLLVTAGDLKLVLVRIERRETGADQVIEVDLWSGGRRDGMSAVAGVAGNPLPDAVEGARRLLRESVHDPQGAADRRDLALITPFVERGDWLGLIAAVAARTDPSPRLRHAMVMACLRQGDRAGAAAALDGLQKTAPEHVLTREAAAALAADGDSLRDTTPADDGGNILR